MKSISQSPTDTEFVQNPYPVYDQWRDAPFIWWSDYGWPVSAQYEVVNAILRDRRFGREAPVGFEPQYPDHLKPFYDFESRSMLEREPPTHTRLRGLVLRAFTSRRIESIRQDIEEITRDLIDKFPTGEFDLLPHFAEKIPVIVIARMVGINEADCDQLLEWSHDMVAMYQANRNREIEDRAIRATLAFDGYIREIAQARRRAPRDDLLTHLLAAEADGEKLSMDELVTTVILLLNAGHEATIHAIGNGVKTLCEEKCNPLDYDMAALVEETIRFDPPLHIFTRYAMSDIEIFGHQFKTGDQIGLLLAAANRDQGKYNKPNEFMPTRQAGDQLAFGAGLHFCLGAPLARMEVSIAIETLFSTCKHLTLTRKPVYANRYHFHGLESLWVKT